MARLPRLALAQQAHLVVLRAQAGRRVLAEAADREAFCAALREAAHLHQVAVEAYALADEHVHLLLRPQRAQDLSAAMQALGRRFVAGHNRRHGTQGSPWAGRFRAAVVEPGEWSLRALIFVDGHAWRARGAALPRPLAVGAGDAAPAMGGEVSPGSDATLPDAAAWSSAPHHLGRRRDALVADGPIWWALGNTPFEREAAFRAAFAEPLSADLLRRLSAHSQHGWALGGPAFLAMVSELVQRPVQPRPRGRPRRDAQA